MEVDGVVVKVEKTEVNENLSSEAQPSNGSSETLVKTEHPEMDQNSSTEPESVDRSNKENLTNVDNMNVEENPSVEQECNDGIKVEKEVSGDESKAEDRPDENVVDKNLDPYAYLSRPEFSSENFKVEIMNLPKFYGAGELKKFLKKLDITTNKMKTMKTFAFVSFRNEAERDAAMGKLKGTTFKGRTIDVKLAKPMQDPLIRKRKANAESEGEKKPRICEPINDQVTKKTVPYAGKPYEEQLKLKKEEMMTVLKKLTKEIKNANLKALYFLKKKIEAHQGYICDFAEVIPSPVTEKYRNKCEFTAGVNPDTDELTLGFRVSTYKEGSIAVGPISHLAFISDAMQEVVRVFEMHFRASGRKAFNPEDHSGFWRQILVRSNLAGEVLVIVMVHPQDLSTEEMESVKNELKSVAEANKIASLYFQALGKKQSGEDPPLQHITGATNLVEKLCGLEFSISPLAFFQVNTLAAEVLYNKIGEIAEIDANTNILDVCCGTGTIGLSLSKNCRRVYGVDIVESAVEDARRNAERNGITNCVFVAGKAEEELDNLIKQIDSEEGAKDSKIVAILDPPRAGLHRKCCQLLRSTERIERVIYISCNAQQAMKSFVDLCRAPSNAYSGVPFIPVKAMAVDLFPDTPHCEFILVLERFRPI